MLFAEEACQICGIGTDGMHPACAAGARAMAADFEADNQAMLQKHALFQARGIQSDTSRESLARAVACLTRYLKQTPDFDSGKLIEGDDWWFIPHGWIGVMGFVVEKSTQKIFILGSGLASTSVRRYSCWSGIEAYLAGGVKPV